MKEYTVTAAESGQHCIKLCKHLLPKAENGFLHKMLRKKNITVNGKKAEGSKAVYEGDVIRFYFSDETIELLSNGRNSFEIPGSGSCSVSDKSGENKAGTKPEANLRDKTISLDTNRIIYEDEQLIIYDKPAGQLSQKANPSDISANELLCDHLKNAGNMPKAFTPSVVNRLDRNTSGILLFTKTYESANILSGMLKDRTLSKYYIAIVAGKISEHRHLKAFLEKDERINKVSIINDAEDNDNEKNSVESGNNGVHGSDNDRVSKDRKIRSSRLHAIETELIPVESKGLLTKVKLKLITGKPHQLRAQLAAIGTPILGDMKYGDRGKEKSSLDSFESMTGKKTRRPGRQLLHAYSLTFPDDMKGALSHLSGKTFTAPLPKDMQWFDEN